MTSVTDPLIPDETVIEPVPAPVNETVPVFAMAAVETVIVPVVPVWLYATLPVPVTPPDHVTEMVVPPFSSREMPVPDTTTGRAIVRPVVLTESVEFDAAEADVSR
jgi:hypothetical protein